MDSELPPISVLTDAPAATYAPVPKHPWYSWRRLGLNFLTLSLLVHLLLGIGAAYLVVAVNYPKKRTFVGGSSGAAKAAEHKVSVAKARQRASAPASVKRVTTTGLSRVALPVMPTMPLDSAVTPIGMRGMTGQGAGIGGMGGGGTGDGTGNGRAPTFFGFQGRNAGGLEGTFYDYKINQQYQSLGKVDRRMFGRIVRDVLPTNGPWHPEQPYNHFVSPAKLHGRYFVFPAIEDTGAGAAFQSPRSGPGIWLAVYRGAFSSPKGGSFRFVGFGDNVMIVQVGNHMVLDASDLGYTGQHREALGSVKFPKKAATPLFAGEWFTLNDGEAKDIAIAVGDEGGIFCSGLFIQSQGALYSRGENGIPRLPLFMLGAPTPADKQLLGKLPEACLQGPFFTSVAPRPAETSIFSH